MSVRTIGVVGAGTMGAGIAQVAAGTGFQVILIDVNETALSKAMERIGSGFDRLVAKGQMSREAKQAAIGLIATGTDYAALAPADLVVEAATENAEVKEKIVQAVDKVVRADADHQHKHVLGFHHQACRVRLQSRPVSSGCTSSIQCR